MTIISLNYLITFFTEILFNIINEKLKSLNKYNILQKYKPKGDNNEEKNCKYICMYADVRYCFYSSRGYKLK